MASVTYLRIYFFYGISVYKVPVRMIVGETRDGVPFNRFVSQSVPPNIYF